MQMTRIFQNGNSQALRIPQEFRTDTKEYFISRIGGTFIAYPALTEKLFSPDPIDVAISFVTVF